MSGKAATYRHLARFVGELNTMVVEGTTAIDDVVSSLQPAPPEDCPEFTCLDRYPADPHLDRAAARDRGREFHGSVEARGWQSQQQR
jgi:hypothetical protein